MGAPACFRFQGTDRYRVVRELGAGGMGIVYEVVDQERQHRLALKTTKYIDSESLYLSKREFRSLQDLSHPNLVTFYELFVEDNLCYYTMELIDGVDFVSYCTPEMGNGSQPFDETRLRDALRQLAQGIDVLHAADKVHRDIKPSTVLVDHSGRVVLLDFGLVASSAENSEENQTLRAAGTPKYMAPEQLDLDTEVSSAADMYSVGVMLYQVLTGKFPLDGQHGAVIEKKKFLAPPAAQRV